VDLDVEVEERPTGDVDDGFDDASSSGMSAEEKRRMPDRSPRASENALPRAMPVSRSCGGCRPRGRRSS